MKKLTNGKKNLRECYEALPPKEGVSLKNAFMLHFGCSANTFYRALDADDPRLSHVSWFYERAGFVYNFETGLYFIETVEVKNKYGLTLNV